MRNSNRSRRALRARSSSLAFCALALSPLDGDGAGRLAHRRRRGAAPRRGASTPSAPAPMTAAPITKETVDNPYGLGALWEQGDFVSRGTLIILVLMSMGSWYILITKLYESLKLSARGEGARNGPSSSRKSLQRGAQSAEDGQRVPLHRRQRHRGERAPRRRADREHRPQLLGLDERPAQHRRRAEPPAGRPRLPRDGRLDGAVRRPVRHGLGHLPRADGDRHRRPGVDRQGRRPGRRGADHDRDRPGGRGAGGARLQLAGPPQQGDDGVGAPLRRRPARRADGCAPAGRAGAAQR